MLHDLENLTRDGCTASSRSPTWSTNLRNFSRLDRSRVASYNVNESVRGALLIARPLLRNVDVDKRLGEVPSITCSPSQVNQVLLNLVTNAAQAIDKPDGRIIVTTRARGAASVAIEVSDKGRGIPAGRAAAHLRSVLHHQGRRARARAWACRSPTRSCRARRPHRRGTVRRRHDVHRDPADGAAARERWPATVRQRQRKGFRMSTARRSSASTRSGRVSPRARARRRVSRDRPRDARPVAMKVIAREHVDAQAAAGVPQVRRVAGTARPSGIARFIEVVETPKALCTRHARSRRGSRSPRSSRTARYPDPRIAWEIMRQVLETLAVAHVHGAVHRDIKASNVLLAIGWARDAREFRQGADPCHAADHVEHFAPEHFGEGKVAARSDLYQVGILVYQLVRGKVPFTGTADEIQHRVMQERPTDPSSYNNRARLAARLGGAEGALQGSGRALRVRARIRRRPAPRPAGHGRASARAGEDHRHKPRGRRHRT